MKTLWQKLRSVEPLQVSFQLMPGMPLAVIVILEIHRDWQSLAAVRETLRKVAKSQTFFEHADDEDLIKHAACVSCLFARETTEESRGRHETYFSRACLSGQISGKA